MLRSGVFPLSSSVVSQVRTAMQESANSIEVLLDISPEGCFDSSGTRLIDRTQRDFTSRMISAWDRGPTKVEFFVSCGAGRAKRALRDLSGLIALYRDQAVKPAALDLHIYERDRSEIRRLLAAADAAATKLGVPLDINETYYDHADLFNELSPKVAGEELNSIRALLVFPRRSKSYCQIDVDAPYDMTSIGAAIGQCGQQR